MAIAREPGSRTKVAVHSKRAGNRSGRRVSWAEVEPHRERFRRTARRENRRDSLRARSRNVHFECARAGQGAGVELFEDEGIALVTVPDHQLSLAIGREGQNVRLAARLTGWRLDITSDSEAAEARARYFAEREASRSPKTALPNAVAEEGRTVETGRGRSSGAHHRRRTAASARRVQTGAIRAANNGNADTERASDAGRVASSRAAALRPSPRPDGRRTVHGARDGPRSLSLRCRTCAGRVDQKQAISRSRRVCDHALPHFRTHT